MQAPWVSFLRSCIALKPGTQGGHVVFGSWIQKARGLELHIPRNLCNLASEAPLMFNDRMWLSVFIIVMIKEGEQTQKGAMGLRMEKGLERLTSGGRNTTSWKVVFLIVITTLQQLILLTWLPRAIVVFNVLWVVFFSGCVSFRGTESRVYASGRSWTVSRSIWRIIWKNLRHVFETRRNFREI